MLRSVRHLIKVSNRSNIRALPSKIYVINSLPFTSSVLNKESAPTPSPLLDKFSEEMTPEEEEPPAPSIKKMYMINLREEFVVPYGRYPLPMSLSPLDLMDLSSQKQKYFEGFMALPLEVTGLEDPIGIEVKLLQDKGVYMLNSDNHRRFKILDMGTPSSQVATVLEFEDVKIPQLSTETCILRSDLIELTNTWHSCMMKVQNIMKYLPQESYARLTNILMTLSPITQNVLSQPTRGPAFIKVFNQTTYQMAKNYYEISNNLLRRELILGEIFEGAECRSIFREENSFLSVIQPLEKSRRAINMIREISQIFQKMENNYMKAHVEAKEREKKAYLEESHRMFKKDGKKSDKEKYSEKLEEVVNISEGDRRIIQGEINSIEDKNESENMRIIEYLNIVFRLPWDKHATEIWDPNNAKVILDESHYALNATKQRIIEFIAKNKRLNNKKGMILLLHGPPGVGKTSIARSIAESLGRPSAFITMSAQSDTSYIKGFKRLYVDSQPGIFIKEIAKTGIKNPVFIIDEIDKIASNSFTGDVGATLLELLNVEQNNAFVDYYMEIPFDFSSAIFICTANTLETLLDPLIDRIETIKIDSYLPNEKYQIAIQYLIPRLNREFGFRADQIAFGEGVLELIIKNYTKQESGVRNVNKSLERIFRKIAMELEVAGDTDRNVLLHSANLERYLDWVGEDTPVCIQDDLPLGTSNGLAYIDDGYGSLLQLQMVMRNFDKEEENSFDEISISSTGNLGEVFKESIEVIKILAQNRLNDKEREWIREKSFHLHAPKGSIPKDGPSAGIGIYSALMSLVKGKALPKSLAMTGELTTLGETIPIGGIKEKLLGCKNNNVTKVILPEGNRKDVEKLTPDFLEGFEFVFVRNIEQIDKELWSQ